MFASFRFFRILPFRDMRFSEILNFWASDILSKDVASVNLYRSQSGLESVWYDLVNGHGLKMQALYTGQ